MSSLQTVIYGAGQLGQMVAEILALRGDVQIIGFVDDDAGQVGRDHRGLRVVGDGSVLAQLREQGVTAAISAVGGNRARGQIATRLVAMGFEMVSAVHPTAHVSDNAVTGTGLIVAAGAVICGNSAVGDNLYMGPMAGISHDVTVGDNVLMGGSSYAAGRTDIGSGAFIGVGAKIVPANFGSENRLRIGENVVVGAGAVVLSDVPANAVVIGMPARILRYRAPETP